MKNSLCALCLCLTACLQPVDVPTLDAGPDGGDIDASTYIDAGVPDAGFDAGVVDPGVISDQMGDRFQAEPTVAGGPNGQRVVAWLNLPMSVGRYQVAYAVSLDEGRTFSKIRQATTPDGWWARSPVLTSGPDGIWLAWPAIHLSGSVRDDVRILASHIASGSTDLEAPVTLDDGSMQVRYGPSIVALDSKTIVAAYTESAIAIASRDSAGNISRATLNEPGTPALCTDGTRVYAVCENSAGVAIHWSDDEGKTWPAANAATFPGDPDLAYVQPRCAASGDSVWVMFGADASSNLGSGQEVLDAVLLARSKDRGVTWAGEVDVKPPTVSYAMLPNLVAAGGEAYLDFYTGEMAGDPNGAVMLVRAGDMLEASVVAHQPLTFMTARMPPSWQGDALGISVFDGHVDVVYANDTQPSSHVALFGIDGAAIGVQVTQ
jgi:hypothetical protein